MNYILAMHKIVPLSALVIFGAALIGCDPSSDPGMASSSQDSGIEGSWYIFIKAEHGAGETHRLLTFKPGGSLIASDTAYPLWLGSLGRLTGNWSTKGTDSLILENFMISNSQDSGVTWSVSKSKPGSDRYRYRISNDTLTMFDSSSQGFGIRRR